MVATITPAMVVTSTRQLMPGSLVLMRIMGKSRYGLVALAASSDNDPVVAVLGPFDAGAGASAVIVDTAPAVNFGEDWSINAEARPEDFYFPADTSSLFPGSLLLSEGGPTAIALQAHSRLMVFFHFERNDINGTPPSCRAALLRWKVQVPATDRPQTLFTVSALPAGTTS